MRARLVATICVTAFAAAALAQTALPVADSSVWVGQVTGTNVYVRSAPDDASYPCLKLSAPDKVTVVGKADDRLKIVPPPEAFSVIAKSYVAPDAGGTQGTVTGDNVRVRAGTSLMNWNRLIDHYAVQLQLNRGDKVTIIGQEQEYYKIAPPKGVYLYIAAKYVKATTEQVVVREQPPATTQPIETEPQEVEVKPTSAETVKAELEAFRALEAKLKAEFDKPAEARDLAGMLAEYRALDAGEKGYLKPYIDARVKFLEAMIQRLKEAEDLDQTLREVAAKQREFELDRTKIEVVTATRPAPATFAAQGILLPSAVFTGTGGAAKRFLIRDPATLHITAYAQSTQGLVDLTAYVGKEVALVGSSHYDRSLDSEIVEVKQVVVLKERVDLSGPPSPVVKPYTPPRRPAPPPPMKVEEPVAPPVAPPEPPKPPPAPPKELPAPKPPERPLPELPKLKPLPEPPGPQQPQEPPAQPDKPVRPMFEEPGKPTTKPAAGSLPPTGLPLIVPADRTTTRPVNEEEFD